LTRAIADSLRAVATPRFSFLDLTHFAQRDSADLYTDYCHLTSLGNRRLAERLVPQVAQLLGPTPRPPRS
jgi:lysophospholipase L1-like esterase